MKVGTCLAALLVGGCAAYVDYAPRTPKQPSRPTAEAAVELHLKDKRPTCDYEVIGSVFSLQTDALAPLRKRAAQAGANGVYDIHCEDATLRGGPVRTEERSRCTGRAYVCKGPEVGAQR